MYATFVVICSVTLFLVGLRLSAFFSGSETGFYRVNFLRVSIDAQAGEPTAQQLVWFLKHPGHFVATTLVGNNVSNYLTTFAISMGAYGLWSRGGEGSEIIATLLLTPLVFILGELIPKSLYYRSPLKLLSRDVKFFRVCYFVFLPVSYPLIQISKLFDRVSKSQRKPGEQLLGRKRLVQVLGEGHREGLLTDVQSRLVNGLLEVASSAVTESMIPKSRIMGVSDSMSREDMREYARRLALTSVLVRGEEANSWYGYIRTIDLSIENRPLTAITRPLPTIDIKARKLEALVSMREQRQLYARVENDGDFIGVISDRGLTESLFRSVHLTQTT